MTFKIDKGGPSTVPLFYRVWSYAVLPLAYLKRHRRAAKPSGD